MSTDLDRVAAALDSHGLTPVAVSRKLELFARAFAWLRAGAESNALRHACYVPGRIEVLGKHTDYAGGRSLLCAVERGICFAYVPRADDHVRVADVQTGDVAETRLSPSADFGSSPWTTYPRAVVRRVARNFPGAARGVDVAFASDLPAAAGLSSSSALIVGSFLAVADANGLAASTVYQDQLRTREDLATYIATIENGSGYGTLAGDTGVGTFGGSEDHTAILTCRAGWLAQYAFTPTRFERDVRLPADLQFVIAVSGVVAEKTGAAREAYNRASRAAQRVLQIWNRESHRRDTSLAAACASTDGAVEQIEALVCRVDDTEFSGRELRERFRQFCLEALQIVPSAAEALAAGDLATFGALVERSQDAAERGLHNQVPETVALVRLAREHGAIAASAFGAGFGGSVWALARRDQAERLTHEWQGAYVRDFPDEGARSTFFVTNAGPGVVPIDSTS